MDILVFSDNNGGEVKVYYGHTGASRLLDLTDDEQERLRLIIRNAIDRKEQTC